MSDFVPRTPYNRRTWCEMLESRPIVPETEDRETLRIPRGIYELLYVIKLEHDESMTSLCSLGIYYSKDAIKRTYDVDWESFGDWYQDYLSSRGAKYPELGERPPIVTFGNQPACEEFVHIRPKGRDMEWLEKLGSLVGLRDQRDVFRLLLYYACVLYDWETFAHDKDEWEGWLETPRRAVHELEIVIDDRRERIDGGD